MGVTSIVKAKERLITIQSKGQQRLRGPPLQKLRHPLPENERARQQILNVPLSPI